MSLNKHFKQPHTISAGQLKMDLSQTYSHTQSWRAQYAYDAELETTGSTEQRDRRNVFCGIK